MAKADVQHILIYAMLALVAVLVIIVGYRAIGNVASSACESELVEYQLQFLDLNKQLRKGSVKELAAAVPCGADQVLFVDSELADTTILSNYPLVQESVESGVEDNAFLLKEGKIMGSFDAGDIDVPYPSLLCLRPKDRHTTLFVENKGKTVRLTSECGQPQCTAVPIGYSLEQTRDVLTQASTETSCRWCPSATRIELSIASSQLLDDHVSVSRSFEFCEGKTRASITVQPQSRVENYRYFESFPSECVDDLSSIVTESTTIPSAQGDSLISDSFFGWYLKSLREETVLTYSFNTQLSEACLNRIQGASMGSSSGQPVGNVPTPTNPEDPLVITSAAANDVVSVGAVFSHTVTTNKNVDNVRFVKVQGPANLNIDQQGRMLWITQESDVGTHTVVIRAQLGRETTEQTMELVVE